MYYIRIENDNFGFVVEGIHEILETDIKISDEDYNKFFELQSQGKQFRVKDVNGINLFEILEEYEPVVNAEAEEDKMTRMFKAVLAGDMQTLAYELYPGDFEEEIKEEITVDEDFDKPSTLEEPPVENYII